MAFRTQADTVEHRGFRTEHDKPAEDHPNGWMDAAKSFGSNLLEGAVGVAQGALPAANPMVGMALLNPMLREQVRAAAPQAAGGIARRIGGEDAAKSASEIVSLLVGGSPQAFTKAHGLHYDPQTTAGRYAGRAGAYLPGGMLAPGSIPVKLATTGLAAAGGQGGREAAKAMGLPAWGQDAAELAGALLGGLPMMARQHPDTASRMLADATRGATDDQVALAAALMKRGQGLPNGGVKVTGDEALAQVTGGGTGIQRLSRGVSSTRGGGDRVVTALKDRPAQIRQAAMGTFDQIAPPVTDPSAVGLRGQAAAEGAIRDVKGARTAAVSPDYEAANPQAVDPAGMKALLADIDTSIVADKTGLIGGRLKDLRSLLAASPDVQNLDRVRKFFRDKIDLPIGSHDALSGEEAKAIGGFLQRLSNEPGTGLLDAVPAFATGKAKYQALTGSMVEPVTSGPIGRIATEATDLRADPAAQGRILYPTSPSEGAANETVAALRGMNARDPSIGADLTRLHLTNRFNEAAQDLQSGQNHAGGARFATDVAANREQEANLMAGVGEVAPGAGPTIQDLLEVLRATGRRGNEGSPTAGYQQFAKDLGIEELPVELAKAAARPWSIPKRYETFREGKAIEKNSDKILDVLLAEPDEFAAALTKARRQKGGGSRELVRALSAYGAAKVAEPKQPKE